MSKLIIIGNGFDLAHKLPTKYEDFRQYLISLLEDTSDKDYSNYDFTDSSIITTDYSNTKENEILVIMYFLSIAENELEWYSKGNVSISIKEIIWKDIEKSVGSLNFEDFSWLYIDESEDDKEYRANWINQDIFSPYTEVLCKIPTYFKMWINKIDISETKNNRISDLERLFDINAKFLCFNYTNTLEMGYNICKSNICYIHGKAKENKEIFFGHGNELSYDDFINVIRNPNYFSVAEEYTTINEVLRKPVKSIIEQNENFFKELSNVEEVYSYGFSYSKVDEPYIITISNNISRDANWNINSYPSEQEKNQYKEIIKKCGYQGNIKEFD